MKIEDFEVYCPDKHPPGTRALYLVRWEFDLKVYDTCLIIGGNNKIVRIRKREGTNRNRLANPFDKAARDFIPPEEFSRKEVNFPAPLVLVPKARKEMGSSDES